MSGEYFALTSKTVHVCALPRPHPTGKGWRCECGKAYVIELLPARDTNLGESPYQWRRAPEHDRKRA